MVQAHDRLQHVAAEMNALRLSTTRNLLSSADMDSLSQQLSQIPGDLTGGQPPVVSPLPHRSKRTRVGDTPLAQRIQRTPMTALRNPVTCTYRNFTK